MMELIHGSLLGLMALIMLGLMPHLLGLMALIVLAGTDGSHIMMTMGLTPHL